MTVYTFDHTLDGLLTAVFDAYALHQMPDSLSVEGEILPMFCNEVHQVHTAEDKARRVWAAIKMMTIWWDSSDVSAMALPTATMCC